jgi:hypothetical protein
MRTKEQIKVYKKAWNARNATRMLELHRVWRKANPNSVAQAARRKLVKTKEYLRAAKSKPCMDCGVQYPYYVMQFDHVRGTKEYTLASSGRISIPKLQAEIQKCDVVCANCHATRTFNRLNSDPATERHNQSIQALPGMAA